MRVGYTDYYNIWSYLRVAGETPSTVELDAIQIGYQKKAENNKYVGINFQVSDVTGDDGVDLYVKSPITENTGLSYASGYRTNMGVYKQGAGTVELSASTSCCTTGVFKIEAGTVRFPAKSAGRFGALQVTGDCTMDVARSARIEFDAATEAWTAGKTLVLTGDIGPKSIRVGTDATGLSADQLAQIKYRFGDGADDLASVGIDANGYLTCRYFHRGLVFVIE